MNHSIRKTALAAAVALPAALGVQTASAAMITQWNYQIDSAFTDYSPGEPAVTGSDNRTEAPFNGDPTTLSWGEPLNDDNAQSQLLVDSDVDGSDLVTNDPGGVEGATFTHNNRVITASSTDLDTFQLSTQLFLSAVAPDMGDATVGPIRFNGNFIETDNEEIAEGETVEGECFEGSTSACDDIFILENAANVGTPDGDGNFTLAAPGFIIEDFQYNVFLDISGLGLLTDEQCDLADADPGCIGFLTEESTSNNFTSTVRITATEIPAPGVLALLGVGLLGLGFAHRGRRS